MLEGLLSGALKPLWAKALAALIPLAMIAAGAWIITEKNRDKKLVETGKEAGAAGAVVDQQNETLTQIERANDAEDQVRRSDDAGRYERCLRLATAETRANCERFKPVSD